MKKIITIKILVLTILLLGFTKYVSAQQEFAPIGAEWYYNRPNTFNLNNFIVFKSIKDTIIEQKSCKIIECRNNNGTSEIAYKEYFYQDSEKIYYLNHNDNKFYLLYDFSAKAGDTITVHENSFIPNSSFLANNQTLPFFKYVIIDVENIEVSGEIYVRQKIKDVDNSVWGFVRPFDENNYNYIINNIGSLVYMFGASYNFVMENEPLLLRCYKNIDRLYLNPLWTDQCDKSLSANIVENNILIKVFPNPFENEIYIKANQDIIKIEVFSILGNKVYSKTNFNSNNAKISLNSLNKGCYMINIVTKDNNFLRKIIK